MRPTSVTRLLVLLAAFAARAAGSDAAKPGAGPYDPAADPARDLAAAASRAAGSGKNVLAVVGGNWCGWCRALDRLMAEDPAIRVALASGFEVVHVNFSKENVNEKAMGRLGRPDKLGFPALVVLSPKLEVLHVQEAGSLELADKSARRHDPEKVLAFLKAWSPAKR